MNSNKPQIINPTFLRRRNFWESACSEDVDSSFRAEQSVASGPQQDQRNQPRRTEMIKFQKNFQQLLEKNQPQDAPPKVDNRKDPPAVIGSDDGDSCFRADSSCGKDVRQPPCSQLEKATVSVKRNPSSLKKKVKFWKTDQEISSENKSLNTAGKQRYKMDLDQLLERKYNPQDAELKVDNRRNIWDSPYSKDGASLFKPEIICGFAVPQSLTSQLCNQLDQVTVSVNRNPSLSKDVNRQVDQGSFSDVKCLEPARKQSGLNLSHQEEEEKKYDPLDQTLKFVSRKDDLDPLCSEDEEDHLRAEMSCGHAVTPQSLTLWCRSQLDQGKFKFTCPAVVHGTKLCNKEWSYQEVRRLADLTVAEMRHFEDTIARLAAAQYCENQPCPQCKTKVERKNSSNLCVQCTICTADQKKTYQFCWQCQKQWKGPAPRSDRCDNKGCTNKDLELLQTCKTISLPEVRGVTNCPSVRACPTCGLKVEHSRQHCKNINCPRCHKEFCFVCLKLKSECIKTSSPYSMCSSGVAPRQTSVPVWQRK